MRDDFVQKFHFREFDEGGSVNEPVWDRIPHQQYGSTGDPEEIECLFPPQTGLLGVESSLLEYSTEDLGELLKRLPKDAPVTGGLSEQQVQEAGLQAASMALLSRLLSPNWQMRINAIELARMLGGKVLSQVLLDLTKSVHDPFVSTRTAATEALGQLGGKDQVDALLDAIIDLEWAVRVSAVRGLGRLGKDAPLETLVTALEDPDISVKDAAIWALKPLALWALKERKDSVPWEKLILALKDESEIVRAAAVEALGDLEEWVPVEKLIDALGDESEIVRVAAVEALGKLEEWVPVEKLIDALGDESEFVRATTVKVLGTLGERAPIEPLILAVKDRDETVRSEASIVLGRLFEQVYRRASTGFLLSLLKDECEEVKALAVWALAERNERSATGLIELALQNASGIAYDAAKWALRRLNTYQSLDHLGEAVHEQPGTLLKSAALKTGEGAEYRPTANDLILSLVDFMREKKGYIAAEARKGKILVIECYYQTEGQSVHDAVFKTRRGHTRIQHLGKAMREEDKTIQDLTKQIVKKRERRKWTETFMVALDLYTGDAKFSREDTPDRIIVCSTAFHRVRADDVSICQSIDRYLDQNKNRSLYSQVCTWIDKCKEPVFEQGQGIKDVKIWYDSATLPIYEYVADTSEPR